MFHVYVLKSEKTGKHYIGSTEDLTERIIFHNHNRVKSTKNKGPWQLAYSESYKSRSEAQKRELQIKSYKGGNNFKKLISAG